MNTVKTPGAVELLNRFMAEDYPGSDGDEKITNAEALIRAVFEREPKTLLEVWLRYTAQKPVRKTETHDNSRESIALELKRIMAARSRGGGSTG
jgi:hypothetical protein